MEKTQYKTVLEMATLWEVNPRTVQKWASSGKLPGACKLGRDWLIPHDSEAPLNISSSKKTAGVGDTKEALAMPLMNGSFLPGKALDYISSLDCAESSRVAMAEYYYFCGDALKASAEAATVLDSQAKSIRLSALWVHAFANIELGEISLACQDFAKIKGAIKGKGSTREIAVSAFVASMTVVLLHKVDEEAPQLEDFVKYLPQGMKLYAFYALAHLWYLKGDYSRSLGIAETGLAMMEATYPISLIYLNLIAAIDCMNLQDIPQGKAYFSVAWALAQKDGFLQPFAEHHGLLAGLVEVMLKEDYPKSYKKIIANTYCFSDGWRKIHNLNTQKPITDVLTTTEFAIAMMASKKWSNRQIAEYLQCSESTIKTHLGSIYRKLGITDRGGLKQFLLK